MSVGKKDYLSRLQTLLVLLNFEWHCQNKVGNIAIPVLWRNCEKTLLYDIYWPVSLMVHSHLRFSQLLRELELIIEQWVTLYYMGAFTPAIWSTIAWTEKFNNGLCTHFSRLHGLKSSRNSSCLKYRRCELSLKHGNQSRFSCTRIHYRLLWFKTQYYWQNVLMFLGFILDQYYLPIFVPIGIFGNILSFLVSRLAC